MGITVNAGKIPVFQRIRQGGLKSREEKLERQQNRDRQIETLEKQKADLKNKECGSLEEIKDKLDLLHSYEDQIIAVKQAFNNEQMHHILDEAREKGEKIAEEIKKFAPKTKEEREKELQEEALGIEEDQGMLSELMEELTEVIEEELAEEIEEELSGEVSEELEELSGELAEEIEEGLSGEVTGEIGELTGEVTEEIEGELSEEVTAEIGKELSGEISKELPKEAAVDMAGETVEEAAENMTEELPEREAEKLAEQHTIEMRKRAEEALAMHGKAGVGIDRYLDYYKL